MFIISVICINEYVVELFYENQIDYEVGCCVQLRSNTIYTKLYKALFRPIFVDFEGSLHLYLMCFTWFFN